MLIIYVYIVAVELSISLISLSMNGSIHIRRICRYISVIAREYISFIRIVISLDYLILILNIFGLDLSLIVINAVRNITDQRHTRGYDYLFPFQLQVDTYITLQKRNI